MNNEERTPKKHGPGPSINAGEKAKDFLGSILRLMRELKDFRVLIVISLMLAVIGSILSISAPDKLSKLTDEISKGLVVNVNNLKELSKTSLENIDEEKMASLVPNIIQMDLSQKNITRIMLDDKYSDQDKEDFKNVLKEVQVALSNATTKEAKDEAFKKLMYKYNEDGGIMNATYPYVIGENDSKMVENFTKASRKLNDNGEYGAISGLVESEYGLHIVYYMGKCENPYTIPVDNTINFRDTYIKDEGTSTEQVYSDVLMLDEVKLNNLNNKTLFDLIYEGLANDNYSQFESMNLNTMKENYQIEVKVVKNLI